MTATDQVRIIDNKTKTNQAQHDLDRLAYSSGDLRQYKYLTGKDLEYKPSVIKQAKFDYSSLGRTFNRGLKDEDKKRRTCEESKKYWR